MNRRRARLFVVFRMRFNRVSRDRWRTTTKETLHLAGQRIAAPRSVARLWKSQVAASRLGGSPAAFSAAV